MMNDENPQKALDDGYTTNHGLLYLHGKQVQLPEADFIAYDYGFISVERLVKALGDLK